MSSQSLQDLIVSLLKYSRSSLLAIILGFGLLFVGQVANEFSTAQQTPFIARNTNWWIHAFGVGFVIIPLVVAFFGSLTAKLHVKFLQLFKYPRRNLNKKFHLIHFNGRIFLLDNRDKSMRWVKTWHTLMDLGFETDWTDAQADIKTHDDLQRVTVKTISGEQVQPKEYTRRNPIHTQDHDWLLDAKAQTND